MEERDMCKKEAKSLAKVEGSNVSENQKDIWTKYKKKRNQATKRVKTLDFKKSEKLRGVI